jgi:hypothetical protein
MMEKIHAAVTSDPTTATWRHIPEEGILLVYQFFEGKYYVCLQDRNHALWFILRGDYYS